jgi:hypothetical protein
LEVNPPLVGRQTGNLSRNDYCAPSTKHFIFVVVGCQKHGKLLGIKQDPEVSSKGERYTEPILTRIKCNKTGGEDDCFVVSIGSSIR